jgi:glutamate racemase
VRARLGDGDGAPARAEHRFFVTDAPEKFLSVAGRFLGREVAAAEHVDV